MKQNRVLLSLALPIFIVLAGCGQASNNIEGRAPVVLDIGATLEYICDSSDHPYAATAERVLSMGDIFRVGSSEVRLIDPGQVEVDKRPFPLRDGVGQLELYGRGKKPIRIDIEVLSLSPETKEDLPEGVIIKGFKECGN